MSGCGDAVGEEGYRIVAAFASGNACGRIEERIELQGDEHDRVIRIGVVDEERARREPHPEEDFAIAPGSCGSSSGRRTPHVAVVQS